jgi:hypothetical protein
MKTLYDTDFAAWSEQTAALIRAGRFSEIDAENVAEEIESLSRSQHSAVRSQLRRLLTHRIKHRIQPERAGVSWQVSINDAQDQIREALEASPSLRPYLRRNLQEIYRGAIKAALIETGREHADMPDECPWDLDALLD